MAFRALFIGVNKHDDPGIPELTGAVRDAQALHALFHDTFVDLNARLLVDQQATCWAIRAAVHETLSGAVEDDVVVLFFAGHGTKSHELVAFDTDRDDLPGTTIAMDDLAARFQASRARAVLCVLDCCFSGAAPARVLEGTSQPRAGTFDYTAFTGRGRFLLAAASPVQPAWEDSISGHGLLTHSIIEVLTAGQHPVDITIAVGEIISKTRTSALAIGQQQDPTFVGGAEGQIELPVLRRGVSWNALFPDLASVTVQGPIGDLAAFGIPSDVLRQWELRFRGGLNPLQIEAVNRCRILNGKSLLVVAPTSSGKTFIGEMAAVRAALDGRKAVFLLPYRALVNEKYGDFRATYAPAGLRIVRCSGDFTDETGLFLSARYDIAILTFEMFLGLGVGTPHILKRLGLVVVDETQFITDPTRGIVVELLLTLILTSAPAARPQIIALSAVIGDINRFNEWLNCDRLIWTQRPVPLIEGVLDRQGVYQALEANGHEFETQLIPRHLIRQRTKELSAQDVIVPLAQTLVAAGEKLLVFRNKRGPAEGCARYLSRELGLAPAAAALTELPTHDPSTSAAILRECLASGTAFHNSNLRRDERIVVEQHFRNPTGGIQVLAATTTLAAGINTPASTVILAEQEFVGEDGRPFTVAEYKNMAGRAGRLGFNENGKAIILADGPLQRRQLFARYVRGTPESIHSSFSDHDFRTWVIRLLSQVRAIKETDVPRLLANTYGGFLAQYDDPAHAADTAQKIAEAIAQFLTLGLLERHDDQVQLSLLGRACGQSSLAFDSAMRLIEAVKAIAPGQLSAFRLVALLQILLEADRAYTPIGQRKTRKESARVNDAMAFFGSVVVQALQRWVPDEFAYWGRCKRAAILADWMQGTSIQDIEARYSVPFGGAIQLGDIQRFADATRFHFQSAHRILSILLAMTPQSEQEFELTARQLEFGVPPELIPLMEPPLALSRGEALAASARGLRSAADFASASSEKLVDLFGLMRSKQVVALCEETAE